MNRPAELEDFLRQFGSISEAEKLDTLLIYYNDRLPGWGRTFIVEIRHYYQKNMADIPEVVALIDLLDGHLALREINGQ